ncbi:MAG: hypothetical protein ACI9GW_000797 [Halieaceae bacterium]|jgi:uncharacterized protein (TIGR01777 family)
MNILLSGGTGFIGTALVEQLSASGHQVIILSRQTRPDRGQCRYVGDLDDIPQDEPIDAIINLAGASMAGKRWSLRYKQELVASRVETSQALVQLCGRLNMAPSVFLSASAIGFYGPHADEVLDENGGSTDCFSSDLCRQWEAEATRASKYGVRVCVMRLGVVLDREGGAMVDMARPFKMGVANWMGGGEQWLSWVHRADVIAAILFLLDRQDLSGPFNITAPESVTSRGFCAAMQQHYRTFVTLPVPAFVMRLLMGEVADELLLSGQRVTPAALVAAGFKFSYPALDTALENIVNTE